MRQGQPACTQSSQSYVFIPQNVSGMIAVGDSITIESTDHVITLIEFLIPDETKLTLDGTWTVGSSSTTITVNNAYVKSKTQLPGRASAEAVIVSSAVVGDTEITLTESITAGDYWIEGKSYELGASSGSDESGHVATINASPSCSGTTYCSTATSSLDSDETLYAFTEYVTLYTSKDWSTSLSSSDKIYTGDFEFSVQTVTGAKSITVSGENFRYPLEGAYFFKDGNGAERAVLFKLVDDDVSTSRALVNADWRGTDVQLRTHRADGISAGTYKIGGASEIQVVTFRTANPLNHTAFRMADDEYRQYFAMTFGDSNSETSFGSAFYFGIGDSAEAWKYKLEMFDGIDRVSVERNGDGQSEFYSYGYAYTISFWGRYGTEGIPQIEIGEIRNNTNNINKWDMPFWTTHVETVRQAEYTGDFSSRHVALNENADFQVRMKAFNRKGISGASDVVSGRTENYGSLPGAPESIVLGRYRSDTMLSLSFDEPADTGGLPITRYVVETDSSTSFNPDSSHYQTKTLERTNEVQQITTYYRAGDDVVTRSGTFTVSWGGKTSAALNYNIAAFDLETTL